MYIAFTTVSTPAEAELLARGAVEAGLAACAQIEGPIVSHYRWQGRLEQASEHRVVYKALAVHIEELERWVRARHPYETPEWLVVEATRVGENYLKWARERG